MSGNKVFQILLAVAMFCIMTTAAQAATADSFQSPLANYMVTGYRFGNIVGSMYHAGEDLEAKHPDPVRAIANGVLRQSKEYSDGYGNVVVIEHTLPDGKKIISIYGHLSRKDGYKMIKLNPTGKEVPITKGQIIGYIGKHDTNPLLDENGIGGDHLHLGIKKGAYVANLYEGNVPLSGLSNFHKPSDYLNLIRAVNTPEVYRLANLGNKIWVSSASTFNSCGWRWDDIRPVSAAERNSHSTSSGSPCFAGGTFIKRTGSDEISLIKSYQDTSTIQNRLRHSFGSWDAFIRAGGKSDLSNVRIVSYSEYYAHIQGKTLT